MWHLLPSKSSKEDSIKQVIHGKAMAPKNNKRFNNKFSSLSIILMLTLISFSLTITNVSAVGQNQNDIGTSGGDLPDNLSSPNIDTQI